MEVKNKRRTSSKANEILLARMMISTRGWEQGLRLATAVEADIMIYRHFQDLA